MKSRICEMVGIDFPLFGFSHCRDVVAAVSRAGGFGVLGATSFTPQQLQVELDWIDAHIDGKPYGIDLAIAENMPVRDERNQTVFSVMSRIPDAHYAFTNDLLKKYGVRPVSAHSEHDNEEVGYMYDTAERLMDVAFSHPIRFVVNALGRPPSTMVSRARERGIPVGALVGSKDHVARQVEAGVDVLVAQGTEAAAHCGEISTMVLVPEVVAAAKSLGDVPVLAAGGIVTGRQMAATMAMGADGAWTGSVWLPTIESDIPDVARQAFLEARSRDTLRSRSLSGKPCRVLRTDWTDAWEGPQSPGALPMPFQSLLANAAQEHVRKSIAAGNVQAGRIETSPVGQGVGLLTNSVSVRAVVQDFKSDFVDALERMQSLTS